MIGIVAVSHSARLGEAALELALQMVQAATVRVEVAAGAGEDPEGRPVLGTDAVAVAQAIDRLGEDCDGVLVLMDLGSAVLSAELALELRSSAVPVRLAPAPFVEGLLAAVVSAAAGGDLDAVADEAGGALGAKTGQLGEPELAPRADVAPRADGEPREPGASAMPDMRTRIVRVRNRLGIHARPAALIAEAATGADVRIRRLPSGPEATAASLTRLLTLGARQGQELELSATGDAGAAVLDRLVTLFEEGFGEETDADQEPAGEQRADEQVDTVGAVDRPVPTSRVSPVPVPDGTVLRGRGVSPGLAVAPAVLFGTALSEPDAGTRLSESDRPGEISAIERAVAVVAARLGARAASASGEARAILEASRLLASDPELVSDATALVRDEGRTAARAVWDSAARHESALRALGGRMAERAADIRDVRDRIVSEILDLEAPGVPDGDEPFVLIATDLAPADTAALAGGACVALITEQGGPTSHTAIIARSIGLPAVVGVAGATGIRVGTSVLVDGERGTLEVAPAEGRVQEARAATVVAPFDGTGRLADGTAVPLLANVGGADDAARASSENAEGIGLFRTEFCFLGRTIAPTVDEQKDAYRGVLTQFAGRKVVVRTLDAGSDKPLPFANAEHEENPALGVRGLRIDRRAPELLDAQLCALAAVAADESALVEVMAPMVATVEEARDFATRARAAGIDRVGVMIETPSAALLAAELFEIVDFVSLGTNDLAQYTLAADRMLSDLGDLNDPWQPAVLRLIGTVGAAGRAAGREVGVCGEAAGDPALAPVLVGLGATSLSMTARSLGRVAAALAGVTTEDCRRAAEAVLGATTVEGARQAASEALRGPSER